LGRDVKAERPPRSAKRRPSHWAKRSAECDGIRPFRTRPDGSRFRSLLNGSGGKAADPLPRPVEPKTVGR